MNYCQLRQIIAIFDNELFLLQHVRCLKILNQESLEGMKKRPWEGFLFCPCLMSIFVVVVEGRLYFRTCSVCVVEQLQWVVSWLIIYILTRRSLAWHSDQSTNVQWFNYQQSITRKGRQSSLFLPASPNILFTNSQHYLHKNPDWVLRSGLWLCLVMWVCQLPSQSSNQCWCSVCNFVLITVTLLSISVCQLCKLNCNLCSEWRQFIKKV